MRDVNNPPDDSELSLALAAIFAVAGRKPDILRNTMVWVWRGIEPQHALRLDYWWYENHYAPVDTWTLHIVCRDYAAIERGGSIAGPDLSDILQKLQDPEIRRRFLVVDR